MALAEVDDQSDLLNAKVIPGSEFQRQDFVSVDFEVSGRAEKLHDGKTVRSELKLVGNG